MVAPSTPCPSDLAIGSRTVLGMPGPRKTRGAGLQLSSPSPCDPSLPDFLRLPDKEGLSVVLTLWGSEGNWFLASLERLPATSPVATWLASLRILPWHIKGRELRFHPGAAAVCYGTTGRHFSVRGISSWLGWTFPVLFCLKKAKDLRYQGWKRPLLDTLESCCQSELTQQHCTGWTPGLTLCRKHVIKMERMFAGLLSLFLALKALTGVEHLSI